MTTGLPCSLGRSGLMLYKEQAEGRRGIKLAVDKELTFATKRSKRRPRSCRIFRLSAHVSPSQGRQRIAGLPERIVPVGALPTDGGVFDNLGMDRPFALVFAATSARRRSDQDVFISDAEGQFNQVVGRPWRFKFVLPRNVRAQPRS